MQLPFRALTVLVVLACLVRAEVAAAQSVCRAADTRSALLIKWLGTYSSATSGGLLETRNALKLPLTPANQLELATQEGTCKKVKPTYEAAANAEGGTGLSGRLYVVKVGTVFVAVDPDYHWGADPGWWKVVTMDSRYRKLSETTTKGIP
jgi:hypothetical protein